MPDEPRREPPRAPDPGAVPPPPSAGGSPPPAAGAPPPPPPSSVGPGDGAAWPLEGAAPVAGDAARATDPVGGGDPAQLHRTEHTRTYPCRACGGELHFDIPTQGLRCAHCGDRQPVTTGAPAPEEQDLRAAVAALRSGDLGSAVVAEDEHEVVCQNCGGHTTFYGSLTATKCPYCATPIQRDDVHDAPERLPVDGVLPFRVDEATARDHLEGWVSSRWFAPNAFEHYSEAGSFSSVYAAYFTYDAQTRTRYRGERGDTYTVTVGSGDNRRTEVRVRWSRRSGRISNDFDDVAVLANDGLERRFVAELEPWPTDAAVGFTPQYVAGHLARTYDNDVEACFVEARQRMDAAIDQAVRRDIGGDRQRVHQVDTEYGALSYKHLLLPIWLLALTFNGQLYQVFINGITGEVQGERPWSVVKITLAVLAALVVVGTVLVLRQQA